MDAPECPANYFGKGADYQLPDDIKVVAEYERRWRDWESKHPEDPTGEIALREWEARGGGKGKSSSAPRETMEVDAIEEGETSQLKLEMLDSDIRLLKMFASFKRKRPRDVLSTLIRQNCRIE